MSSLTSLRELLEAGPFTILSDERVYRRQELLSLSKGILETKSLARVNLSDIRAFIFLSVDFSGLRKSGRFGRFVSHPLRFRGREKILHGRVITENRRWILMEVRGVYFLLPKGI